MMLDWLAEKHKDDNARRAARLIERAIDNAFAHGTLVTTELGGSAGLVEVTQAVSRELENLDVDDI